MVNVPRWRDRRLREARDRVVEDASGEPNAGWLARTRAPRPRVRQVDNDGEGIVEPKVGVVAIDEIDAGRRRHPITGGPQRFEEKAVIPKNTICLWYDGAAMDAARFYAETFPDSKVGAVMRAPGDYPDGKQGDVLTVEFTVAGVPCVGLNGGPQFKHNEAFSFQIATDDQAETDRLWNAIVGNGGQESACGWCKDKWGLNWQITPRVLIAAISDPDRAAAKRAFDAMMEMKKIDIAAIEAARRG